MEADDAPGQKLLFKLGRSKRRKPSAKELEDTLAGMARLVVNKFHHGRAPSGMDWDDLRQEVIFHALRRLKNFRHGGKKTLTEYSYLACYYSLRDIHRGAQKNYNKSDDGSTPLFDAA